MSLWIGRVHKLEIVGGTATTVSSRPELHLGIRRLPLGFSSSRTAACPVCGEAIVRVVLRPRQYGKCANGHHFWVEAHG